MSLFEALKLEIGKMQNATVAKPILTSPPPLSTELVSPTSVTNEAMDQPRSDISLVSPPPGTAADVFVPLPGNTVLPNTTVKDGELNVRKWFNDTRVSVRQSLSVLKSSMSEKARQVRTSEKYVEAKKKLSNFKTTVSERAKQVKFDETKKRMEIVQDKAKVTASRLGSGMRNMFAKARKSLQGEKSEVSKEVGNKLVFNSDMTRVSNVSNSGISNDGCQSFEAYHSAIKTDEILVKELEEEKKREVGDSIPVSDSSVQAKDEEEGEDEEVAL
eukprot:g1729.t1